MPDSNTDDEPRECPFCKEEIKRDAVKCKHCGSAVQPMMPEHGGTCPFCKEAIQPGAIICKHCKSSLVGGQSLVSSPFMAVGGCGCRGSSANELAAMQRQPGGRPGTFGGDLNVGERECITRIRCTDLFFGAPLCHLERCCFSETTGTWACIEM